MCGTHERDWQTLLDFLRTNSYPLDFLVCGERQPLPEQVEDIFRLQTEMGVSLNIDEEYLALHCHFFMVAEIEFDRDPSDFQNDQQLSRLLDFIRAVGHLLNKVVVLTPENMVELPIFRFDPKTNEEIWFLDDIDS